MLQNNIHFLKSLIDESNIVQVFQEIQSDRFAKLVGQCCHFCYWCIFGQYNSIPLDSYYLKQLFISMLQCISAIEASFMKTMKMKQVFANFTMPMLILALRIETDIVFKNNYKLFLQEQVENQSQINQKLSDISIN